MTESFNPLSIENLSVSVGNALLSGPIRSLENLEKFQGAGLYAIYYTGNFPGYEAVRARNLDDPDSVPIYVGKAVPAGSRKGLVYEQQTYALWNRLSKDHAKSILQTHNLNVKDFFVRWLVVDPIWIPLGENVVIQRFSPIWNVVVDGFGNHDPGRGRYKGLVPRWDTLHPGRSWARRLQPRCEDREIILEEVRLHTAQLKI